MRRINLITGGVRSGKSRYALDIGGSMPEPRLFIATGIALDEEMNRRIDRHRSERLGLGWQTIEEQTDLIGVLKDQAHASSILVDCLGLWVNNLLFHEGMDAIDEDRIARDCMAIIDLCHNQQGDLVLVTNETGMGIMPENALARRFGDVLGRCNQTFARHATRVVMMISGLPMELKNPG